MAMSAFESHQSFGPYGHYAPYDGSGPYHPSKGIHASKLYAVMQQTASAFSRPQPKRPNGGWGYRGDEVSSPEGSLSPDMFVLGSARGKSLAPDQYMEDHRTNPTDPENQYDFILLPGTMNARPGMKVAVAAPVPVIAKDSMYYGPSSPEISSAENSPRSTDSTSPTTTSSNTAQSETTALQLSSSVPAPTPSPPLTADKKPVNTSSPCRYGSACFRKNCRFRHDEAATTTVVSAIKIKLSSSPQSSSPRSPVGGESSAERAS